ncbi:hypothetical protein CCH79_00019140 [Gambusia affinis]|uniref:BAR domain-containing protein n=1 Tax=Gambusia affinis TaxID=33528 RepID=A0A315VLW1_GAMAF|nr:hypothetical protein CCH79_00019140 [Gambusia affinis]
MAVISSITHVTPAESCCCPQPDSVHKAADLTNGSDSQAGCNLFTEEKLGQAEKTELDPHLENLLAKADSTKNWTEKILRQTEVLLQPNPSARIEEYIYDKLDRKLPSRTTNAELLGQFMLDAAKEFGADTPYGTTLITVGEYQRKLGGAEREFLHTAAVTFLSPLRNFLEGDWRTISVSWTACGSDPYQNQRTGSEPGNWIRTKEPDQIRTREPDQNQFCLCLQKERRLLENRRLDLDICKARLKKAKQAEAKAAATPDFQETRPRNYVLSASASAFDHETGRSGLQEVSAHQ